MINKIYPIPAFTDNYIWACHDSESDQIAVVDPGDANPVLQYCSEHKLKLSHILITHHHPDHTGGLERLLQEFDPQVFGPEPSGIKGIKQFLHEQDSIELFGHRFDILEVPGHTLDHIAYFANDSETPVLFCGDTLFAAGCGRLFEGTPQMMVNSLNKLGSLPGETRVYCTHEYTLSNLAFALAADSDNKALAERVENEKAKRESGLPTLPSSIELELATNPFLRCEQEGIRQNVSGHCGKLLREPVETFAALRSWKDNF